MINGSRKVVVRGDSLRSEEMSLSQFRDAVGYLKASPVPPEPAKDGAPESPPERIVVPDGVSVLQLSPTESLKALTVVLPANPVDGQTLRIFSTQAISALTIVANDGQILHWSPAEKGTEKGTALDPVKRDPKAPLPSLNLEADHGVEYLFSVEDSAWDRIG